VAEAAEAAEAGEITTAVAVVDATSGIAILFCFPRAAAGALYQ